MRKLENIADVQMVFAYKNCYSSVVPQSTPEQAQNISQYFSQTYVHKSKLYSRQLIVPNLRWKASIE